MSFPASSRVAAGARACCRPQGGDPLPRAAPPPAEGPLRQREQTVISRGFGDLCLSSANSWHPVAAFVSRALAQNARTLPASGRRTAPPPRRPTRPSAPPPLPSSRSAATPACPRAPRTAASGSAGTRPSCASRRRSSKRNVRARAPLRQCLLRGGRQSQSLFNCIASGSLIRVPLDCAARHEWRLQSSSSTLCRTRCPDQGSAVTM